MSFVGAVFAVHATATITMAGVVWFVQVVHYPLFDALEGSDFSAYHARHMRRTGWVVVPTMLIELLSAGLILVIAPADLRPYALVGCVLLAVVWGSTFLLQVPLHRRLAQRSPSRSEDCRALVRTNWVRTIGWSLRAPLAMGLLLAVA